MTVAAPMPLLDEPRRPPDSEGWRWETRRSLAPIRDALVALSSAPYSPVAYDGWLVARGGRVERERATLLRRLADLGTLALEQPRPVVEEELRRFLEDVERHHRRTRDLQWDEVELELGGSD